MSEACKTKDWPGNMCLTCFPGQVYAVEKCGGGTGPGLYPLSDQFRATLCPLNADMKQLKVRVKRVRANARIPEYQIKGDSGADIYAAVQCTLSPSERKAIPTGLSVEVPPGYEIQVRSRSGLAVNAGIFVLNSPGTIDSGYRGEIKVILMNLGERPYEIKVGQRIAQIVLAPTVTAEFELSSKLADSERGENGFGSTGRGD